MDCLFNLSFFSLSKINFLMCFMEVLLPSRCFALSVSNWHFQLKKVNSQSSARLWYAYSSSSDVKCFKTACQFPIRFCWNVRSLKLSGRLSAPGSAAQPLRSGTWLLSVPWQGLSCSMTPRTFYCVFKYKTCFEPPAISLQSWASSYCVRLLIELATLQFQVCLCSHPAVFIPLA